MSPASSHSVLKLSPHCEVVRQEGGGLLVRADTGRGPAEWVAWPVDIAGVQELLVWLWPLYAQTAAFQERMKKLLARRGTQENVAAKLGLSGMALSRYRRGLVIPEDDVARRLCELVGWDWPTVAREIAAARALKVLSLLNEKQAQTARKESDHDGRL